VAPPPGAKSLADVKILRPSLTQLTKELPDVKEKWKDTFGM
jgi:hypothetical protein